MRAALALLALAVTCAAPERPRERYNVILIVVDTLRADRLGVYGNARQLTPFTDSLAARGFVFTNAYAPSSHTLPSVTSLLTSRYPTQHGVTRYTATLDAGEITLAEVLHERGYATAAFVSNLLLGGWRGVDQGFDTFWTKFFTLVRGKQLPPRATEINDEALRWLAHLRSGPTPPPFFLYLHYMEPHSPYDPPAPFLLHARRSPRLPDLAKVEGKMLYGAGEVTPELLEDIGTVYDAEVMELDRSFSMLFSALTMQGLLARTLVIITNDHGESLGDHGLFGHGGSLYQDLVHAPLIVLVPGHTTRTDVGAAVSLLDIAPTLLELIGVERPARFEGRSFVDLLVADPWWTPRGAGARWRARGRTAYTEVYLDDARTKRLQAFARGSYKLIVGTDGRREVYDVRADPPEEAPLSSRWAQWGLDEGLRTVTAHIGTPPGDTPKIPIDEETKERLRALGYVDGTPVLPPRD